MKLKDLIPEIFGDYPTPVVNKTYRVDYQIRDNRDDTEEDDFEVTVSAEDMKMYQELVSDGRRQGSDSDYAVIMFWKYCCNEYGYYEGKAYHKYRLHQVKQK